jgi:hypothetical protein
VPHTPGTQSCALRTFADHGAALAFNRDFHPTVEARQICIRCDGALAPTFATRESWPENNPEVIKAPESYERVFGATAAPIRRHRMWTGSWMGGQSLVTLKIVFQPDPSK